MKPTLAYSMLFAMLASSSAVQAKPITVTLNLKERVPMEKLAAEVLNPSSARYHHFYTPAEIRALSAPSDRDYAQLLSELQQKGMKVVSESKSHLSITVETDDAQTTQSLIPQNANLGLSLVDTVTGLTPSEKRRPHFHLPRATSAKFVSQADIKKGYGFNPIYAAGVTGQGQHIAVATYDGFHLDDVTGFFQKSKISPAPSVDVVSFNGTAAVNEDSAAETELDSEFSGMIAPGSKIHVFASAENSDNGELSMFTAILDDNRAKIVNYSWGTCEAHTTPAHRAAMDKLYARAIAQGVNILVASGDSGADGCGNGTKDADWPASAPNVVAVGGTSFTLNGDVLSESGWKESGGGVSKFYNLPAYQSNFQSPYNKRSFPDVSFNADQNTGEQIWTQYQTGKPHWMTIGGTSMAAPQWAGFMALVGESRAKAGKGPLGFLNPVLYAMSSADRAKVMHDVVTGNNGFPAGQGWDAVTGLGSMQADALLNLLTNH